MNNFVAVDLSDLHRNAKFCKKLQQKTMPGNINAQFVFLKFDNRPTRAFQNV